MPDWATRVLTALAAQWRGKVNGEITLTNAEAVLYGIHPRWKLHAALPLLIQSGLIERMRVGRIERGKGIASLYALGWEQIDASNKYDIPLKIAQPPPNAWAQWKKPDDWQQIVDRERRKAQGKKIAQLTRVTQASQPVCTEKPGRQSTRVSRSLSFTGPPRLSPLEISPEAAQKVRKLIAALPHLSDQEAATMLKVDELAVRRIRAGLQPACSSAESITPRSQPCEMDARNEQIRA